MCIRGTLGLGLSLTCGRRRGRISPRGLPAFVLPARFARSRGCRRCLLLPERLQLLPPGGPEVVLLRRHVDGRRRASSPALPYRSRLVLAFGTLDEFLKEQTGRTTVKSRFLRRSGTGGSSAEVGRDVGGDDISGEMRYRERTGRVCTSVAVSLSAQPIALRRTGVPNTPLERC